MTKIASVLGTSDPWGENNDMVTVDVQTDDGQTGIVFRKASSPPLTPGTELTPNGRNKQGKTKFKIVTGYSGSGGGGSAPAGGPAPKGEFRTPEQIIRSTAIGVAVSFHGGESQDAAKVIDTATQFESYITRGAHFPSVTDTGGGEVPF